MPLKYKCLCTQCMTGFMQAEASSSSSSPPAFKMLFCFKLCNSFCCYRCAKSRALAGTGFLCIGYSRPCQCLSSAGCRGLLLSECSSTSLGCFLPIVSALPVASDVQASCFQLLPHPSAAGRPRSRCRCLLRRGVTSKGQSSGCLETRRARLSDVSVNVCWHRQRPWRVQSWKESQRGRTKEKRNTNPLGSSTLENGSCDILHEMCGFVSKNNDLLSAF